MDSGTPYILVAIIGLVLIAIAAIRTHRAGPQRRVSRLAAVAFACVLASMAFGDDRAIGYGLIGIGVALAVIDIFLRRRGTGVGS
jgi:hypothetical protein